MHGFDNVEDNLDGEKCKNFLMRRSGYLREVKVFATLWVSTDKAVKNFSFPLIAVN